MSDVLNITPLHDRVVVRVLPVEDKTIGGLIIPDTAREKPHKGTVVAVGDGKNDQKMKVKVGDTIFYGKYAGTEITINQEDFLIMREGDILAIL